MKKIFLLLVFALMTFTVSFAQESTTVQDVKEVVAEVQPTLTEAERIVEKYSTKAVDAISGLAEALKVPAEHVYGVLVRQQVAEGIALIGYLFLTLLFLFIFWKAQGKANWNSDGNFYNWVAIISGIISFIGIIIVTLGLDIAIIKIYNPEYGAIKEIFELIGGAN